MSENGTRLVKRESGDWDLMAGSLVIELSRAEDGVWTFWAVRHGDDRIGSCQIVAPGSPFAEWLEQESANVA